MTRTFTLTFLGDVMLGRLIDQLLPHNTGNPASARNAAALKSQHPSLADYNSSSPWGTTLPLLRSTDLLLINLETSVTTTSQPWPNKTFNYRAHPANLAPVLHRAHVDYTSLANNHILDYSEEGLIETIWTLKEARISFAGAGESPDEAFKPATLFLPREAQEYHSRISNGELILPSQRSEDERDMLQNNSYAVRVYSASDHPADWKNVPIFHFIDYSPATRARLKRLLTVSSSMRSGTPSSEDPALKIFSVHWGPNYTWFPSEDIQSFAHFLIDECGVDIVHGHSSHHVQGVEVYKRKVIIYGCGDFVDDYALTENFRNDLGAVWRVIVCEVEGENTLNLDRLEIFPTRNEGFKAYLLDVRDEDHGWVREKIGEMSLRLGSISRSELGSDGQIVFDIG